MALRTCVVSYSDLNCRYSAEVTAETLHEAVVLGIRAMDVPQDKLHLLSFDVAVKAPVTWRTITGSGLSAWLSRPGKTDAEQALKDRLKEALRE